VYCPPGQSPQNRTSLKVEAEIHFQGRSETENASSEGLPERPYETAKHHGRNDHSRFAVVESNIQNAFCSPSAALFSKETSSTGSSLHAAFRRRLCQKRSALTRLQQGTRFLKLSEALRMGYAHSAVAIETAQIRPDLR